MSRSGPITLLVLVVLLFLVGDAAAQCAMCKAVVTSNEGGTFGGEQAIGKGLNRGILFLLAIPYLLIFAVFRKKIVAFFKEFASAQG
jgi:hypothetical protein